MKRFGLIVHRPSRGPVNIGDYIQAIAVKQALGEREAVLLEREQIARYDGEELRVVGQGWYCHTADAWPPSRKLDLLPFGMHVAPAAYDHFLRPESLEALRRLGPVGCRDEITLKFLNEHNVAAYFSACLTMTIRPSAARRYPSRVYLIDVGPSALRLLPERLRSLEVKSLSHLVEQPVTEVLEHESLFRIAQERLDEYYEHAAVVVTSRIHALMPSLAMGIPCLWIERRLFDRRIDLARRYSHRVVLPKPDRGGRLLGTVLSTAVNPVLARVLAGGEAAANKRLIPKIDLAAERARILEQLYKAMAERGWS